MGRVVGDEGMALSTHSVSSRPRFYASCVTGYSITPSGATASNGLTEIWGVHDRAYGHRLLREFKNRGLGSGYLSKAITGREQALALVADLTAREAAMDDAG